MFLKAKVLPARNNDCREREQQAAVLIKMLFINMFPWQQRHLERKCFLIMSAHDDLH